MPGSLATASVEIVADTSRFERDLQQKLRKSGMAAGKSFSQSFSKAASKGSAQVQVSKGYGTAGRAAGQQFAKSFSRAASKGSGSAGGGLTAVLTKQGDKAGKSFGARLLRGMMAPLTGIGKLLSSAMDLSMTGGKGGAGPMAALGAAAVAATAAVGPLLGVVAAIPAAISGAIGAVSTLAVAFSGMGEALQAGWSGDMAKFNESLQELAGPAQNVAREIVGLKPAFDGLKESVQGAFFAPLVGQVEQLSGVISGPIQEGMTKLAGALGAATQQMAAFFASPAGGQMIAGIFDGLAASATALAPALVALVKGFGDMSAAAAGSLGGMAPMLQSIGEKMSSFAASGGVSEWLTAASVAAKQLSAAFGALWPGLQALGGMFGAIGNAVRAALIPAFGAVGQTLQILAPIFGQVLTVLGAALNAVIPPAAAALTGLAGALAAALGPALAQVVPFLTQFVAQAGPVLTQGIIAATPALIQLATAIGGFLVAALNTVIPLWQMLGPIIIGAFQLAVPIVVGALQFLAGFINVIVGVITGDFGRMKDGVLGMLHGMFGGFVAILTQIGEWIGGQGEAIIQGFINGMRSAWEGGKSFISGIGSWIAANKGPIEYDRRLLIPAGKAIMGGLDKGIRSQFGQVAKTVHGITRQLPELAMPINAQPMPASHAAPFAMSPDLGGGRTVDNSRTTTVGAPTIHVQSPSADPARVARRTANRLARMSTV